MRTFLSFTATIVVLVLLLWIGSASFVAGHRPTTGELFALVAAAVTAAATVRSRSVRRRRRALDKLRDSALW